MKKFPDAVFEKFQEFGVFRKLNSPSKIQDFLNKIPINFEKNGETCLSPLMVLKKNRAHCIEGAMIAAAILWYHQKPPLLLDLKTAQGDDDHVVALFKEKSRWGSISKTNHPTLRWRDPVYGSVRELVMSYFHEYFLDNGKKTLRSYSAPFNLAKFGVSWLVSKNNLWNIDRALDRSPHFKILEKGASPNLRPADKIERKINRITEWKRKYQD